MSYGYWDTIECSIKEYAKLQERAEKYRRFLENLAPSTRDHFEANSAAIYAHDDKLTIVVPKNGKNIRAVAWMVRQLGFEFTLMTGRPHDNWRTYDRPNGLRIVVHVSSNAEGSLCKRVQVGTETIEQPVYEYVCS